MSAELTEKQKEAFERFKKLKVGALFMRQGTGKTRTALEIVIYTGYLTGYAGGNEAGGLHILQAAL